MRARTHAHTQSTHVHTVTLVVEYMSDTRRYGEQCVILVSFCNWGVVLNEFSVSL